MKSKIEVVIADITTLHVDAVVNAANNSLLGGGGVDGAIHRAAGPRLLEECRMLGGCETGKAKTTQGYNLPAAFVIHAVGPIWRGGHSGESSLLASAYTNSLLQSLHYDIKSIAFPAISTGAYSYPLHDACQIALNTIYQFLKNHSLPERVVLACFNKQVADIYDELLRNMKE